METTMEPISHESVEVKLENQDLWDKFDTLGTEMVITKVGRRMFPFLKVSIKGLRPDETYMVIVDIVKVDDRRYKFNDQENHWQIFDSRLLPQHPVGMYVHPLCPCQGSEISLQILSFNKVKLTNNPQNVSFGQILLESMGRYVPRISIVSYYDFHNRSWQNSSEFTFKQTEFIAVTAYMNKDITKLKIDNNPFARAYRGNGHKRKGSQNCPYLKDENRIIFDETIEQRSDTEEVRTAYLTNRGESVDAIHVLHVNPSSIIVTDVPPSPSPPSNSPTERDPRLPPATMSTNSEVNVVFGSPTSHVTPIESQGNEAVQNGIPKLEVIETEKSSHGGPEEISETNEGDILCKITDVRSIQGMSLSSGDRNNERMLQSLQYEENDVCLPVGIELENKVMKSLEKLGNRNHHYTPFDYSSKPAKDNTKTKNVSKVNYMLPKTFEVRQSIKEKYHQDGFMVSCSEGLYTGNLASDNTKKNTGVTNAKSSAESPENNSLRTGLMEQRGDKKVVIALGNGKESTNQRDCPGPPDVSQPPTQISRLLNFVNSVSSLPLVKRVSMDTDRNNNSVPSSERSTLLGQKRARSTKQSDETFDSMDYSSVALKSMDQSLKEMTKPPDLLDKLFNSIEPKKHCKNKEFPCTETTSRIESCNLRNSHPQKSLNSSEDLRKLTDPVCVETTNTKRLVAMENGGPAASTTSSLPVVLGSYSIHPSLFSKEQVIELHNQSGDPRMNVSSPTERFWSRQKNVSEVVEKSFNGSEAKNQGMLTEREGRPKRLAIQNHRSVLSDKNNLNSTKNISNSFPPGSQCPSSIQKEYIDLNLSTRSFGNRYKTNDHIFEPNCYPNKGVLLQAFYTFETKVSLRRAPDFRLPEIYSPTRSTFTLYSSNLICSTLPIVTADGVHTSASRKLHQMHRQR